MSDEVEPTRLFLVTPPNVDLDVFPRLLTDALAAGQVAAVLVASADAGKLDGVAKVVVPIIQRAGVAAIVAEDTRIAGRVNADGVHVSTGVQDLRLAAQSIRPKRIVGVGGIGSRHDAMEVSELSPDYLFFGRPHGDTREDPHPKSLDLAEWWSDVANIPAIVMAGGNIGSVSAAAATGAAFVGLHDAVWSHPTGVVEALREAQRLLQAGERRAA